DRHLQILALASLDGMTMRDDDAGVMDEHANRTPGDFLIRARLGVNENLAASQPEERIIDVPARPRFAGEQLASQQDRDDKNHLRIHPACNSAVSVVQISPNLKTPPARPRYTPPPGRPGS